MVFAHRNSKEMGCTKNDAVAELQNLNNDYVILLGVYDHVFLDYSVAVGVSVEIVYKQQPPITNIKERMDLVKIENR